jgi:hypothetical protein
MDALARDPRFLAARKTDQSGQRGWGFRDLPRRSVFWWIGNASSAAVCTVFVAVIAALLWSAS